MYAMQLKVMNMLLHFSVGSDTVCVYGGWQSTQCNLQVEHEPETGVFKSLILTVTSGFKLHILLYI